MPLGFYFLLIKVTSWHLQGAVGIGNILFSYVALEDEKNCTLGSSIVDNVD